MNSPIHQLIEKKSDDSQNITVICRVRPVNQRESSLVIGSKTQGKCLTVHEASNAIVVNTKPESKKFSFDYVADEQTSQEKMFQIVGIPITNNCLDGYNGTIICYGQTGSGKSHTTFGSNDLSNRGLVPRVLEYIWTHINNQASVATPSTPPASPSVLRSNPSTTTSYSCSCCFYEIYQEKVYDLLDPTSFATGSSSKDMVVDAKSLQVREDSKSGVYVEGLLEEFVSSSADAKRILSLGNSNRHVGATNMNRESSRSHAVFLLTIRSEHTNVETGTKRNCSAKFSLLDLAGSERHKDTQTTGDRLKEASQINKSLSTLGNVIKALSDRDRGSSSHAAFVPYRDSKLTFLLRDSLGGNSKTVLVATVSPSEQSIAETLSTLQFAQRAKCIKNVVTCNEETNGNLAALQKEIRTLREQLQGVMTNPVAAHGNLDTIALNACCTPSAKRRPAPAEDLTDPAVLMRKTLFNCSSMLANNGIYDSSTSNSVSAQILARSQSINVQNAQKDALITDLKKQVEGYEKSQLGMKMKLKMRETELGRLKKNTPQTEEEMSVADRIKCEVGCVREELNSEIIKAKMEIAENATNKQTLYAQLEAMIAAESEADSEASVGESSLVIGIKTLVAQFKTAMQANTITTQTNVAIAGSAKSTTSNAQTSASATYWGPSEEVKFQHEYSSQLAALEAQQVKFAGILSEVINQDFTSLCSHYTSSSILSPAAAVSAPSTGVEGLTIEEAIGLRTKNKMLSAQHDAMEGEKNKAMSAIESFHSRAAEQEVSHGKIVTEIRKELETRCKTSEQEVMELKYSIANLTEDLAQKSQNIANLQNGNEETTSELQALLERKEQLYRREILQFKKDNSTLFTHFEGLKEEYMRLQQENEVCLNRKQRLQEELEETRLGAERDSEEHAITSNELHDRIATLEQQIATKDEHHAAHVASIQTLETSIYELNEAHRALQSDFAASQKLCSKYQFEIDNLQEDTDNMYTQQESMQQQFVEFTEAIEGYKQQIGGLEEEIQGLKNCQNEKENEVSAALSSMAEEKNRVVETNKNLVAKNTALAEEKATLVDELAVTNTSIQSVSASCRQEKEQSVALRLELEQQKSALVEQIEKQVAAEQTSEAKIVEMVAENNILIQNKEAEWGAKLTAAEAHCEQLQQEKAALIETQVVAVSEADKQKMEQEAAVAMQVFKEATVTELNDAFQTKVEEVNVQKAELTATQHRLTQQWIDQEEEYSSEKSLLQGQISALKGQVSELSEKLDSSNEENAKLIGHKNTKQKIQMMQGYKDDMAEKDLVIEGLKAETTTLTRENSRLKEEAERLRLHGSLGSAEEKDKEKQVTTAAASGGAGIASKYLSAVSGSKATASHTHTVGGIRPLTRSVLSDKNTNI